ncbi:unnamed protein product [Chrysoparadoxa australica]
MKTASYQLKKSARCLCPVHSNDEGDSRLFLAGTASLQAKNQLHMVQFNEEQHSWQSRAVYSHPDEVCCMSTSPHDEGLVLTCSNTSSKESAWERSKEGFHTGLWRMPSVAEDSTGLEPDPVQLERVADLGTMPLAARALCWAGEDQVVAAGSSDLSVWDLASGQRLHRAELCQDHSVNAAAVSPHQASDVAVATGHSVTLHDTRDLQAGAATTIDAGYGTAVLGLDFNPNKPFHLATCGEGRILRFWDTRKSSTPLKSVHGNASHWITSIRYNAFHDQLLVTAGTERFVNLWRLGSLSSTAAEQLAVAEEEGEDGAADVLIKRFEEHEESVYAVAWSASDPWSFASLAYDGTLALCQVPSAVKYQIIL